MADVRAQPAARVDRRSRTLLPLRHRARHHDGLRVSDTRRDGVRVLRDRGFLAPPAGWLALGMDGLRPGRHRHGHGRGPGRAGPSLGAVHLLPADDRQCILLHRGRARRCRLLDLGRADVSEPAHLEATEPRCAGTVRDVRNGRGILPLGLDGGWCRSRTDFPDHPRRHRPDQHDRRRSRARLLLLDFARDRLFLADASLHRLLHNRSTSDWRQTVQRPDGKDLLHPVPCCRHADRRAPPVRGPTSRLRVQVPALGVHRTGYHTDAADRVHHLRIGRNRGTTARRQGPVRMADEIAMAQPGHARRGIFLHHAWLWRRRWHYQHELSAQQHDP